MSHERSVDPIKRTCVQHFDLAPSPLLRRCAEQDNIQTQGLSNRCQSNRRPDRRCRNQIVSARMTDSRQCIVFGAKAERERTRAVTASNSRIYPRYADATFKSIFRTKLGNRLRCEMLVECKFRMLVNVSRQAYE